MTRNLRTKTLRRALLAGSMIWAVFVAGSVPAVAQDQPGNPPSAKAADGERQAELVFWQSVAESRDRAQYEAYLAAFPQGMFARLAQAKIAALESAPRQALRGTAPKLASRAAMSSMPATPKPSGISALVPVSQSVPVITQPAALEPSYAAQLRKLAIALGHRHRLGSVSVPPRPVLAGVGALELPARFCSEVERNAFHDQRFRPVIAQASQNNAAAIAHMELLTRLATEAREQGDGNGANILSQESQNYAAVAQAAYRERSALDTAFQRLMAVPVSACSGAKS